MCDASELPGEGVPERRQALPKEKDSRYAEAVRALIEYPPDSAGALMTDHFARVYPGMTAAQTTSYLHCIDPQVQTLDNLFVMDTQKTLVGVVSLKEVFHASPEQRLEELMQTQPVTVNPHTDRHEVARLVSHYGPSSIPVVDSAGRMLGIVAADDVIDIFVEQFSGHCLGMVGTDA